MYNQLGQVSYIYYIVAFPFYFLQFFFLFNYLAPGREKKFKLWQGHSCFFRRSVLKETNKYMCMKVNWKETKFLVLIKTLFVQPPFWPYIILPIHRSFIFSLEYNTKKLIHPIYIVLADVSAHHYRNNVKCWIFNRPGIAGAVLQTASSLIH